MTELYSKNSSNMSPVWSRIFTIEAERAEGSYIYATDGKKYLDFTCGIGVANTGHCHPKVVAAIREQAGLFLHGQTNIVVHQPMLRFIEEKTAKFIMWEPDRSFRTWRLYAESSGL